MKFFRISWSLAAQKTRCSNSCGTTDCGNFTLDFVSNVCSVQTLGPLYQNKMLNLLSSDKSEWYLCTSISMRIKAQSPFGPFSSSHTYLHTGISRAAMQGANRPTRSFAGCLPKHDYTQEVNLQLCDEKLTTLPPHSCENSGPSSKKTFLFFFPGTFRMLLMLHLVQD